MRTTRFIKLSAEQPSTTGVSSVERHTAGGAPQQAAEAPNSAATKAVGNGLMRQKLSADVDPAQDATSVDERYVPADFRRQLEQNQRGTAGSAYTPKTHRQNMKKNTNPVKTASIVSRKLAQALRHKMPGKGGLNRVQEETLRSQGVNDRFAPVRTQPVYQRLTANLPSRTGTPMKRKTKGNG